MNSKFYESTLDQVEKEDLTPVYALLIGGSTAVGSPETGIFASSIVFAGDYISKIGIRYFESESNQEPNIDTSLERKLESHEGDLIEDEQEIERRLQELHEELGMTYKSEKEPE